MTVSIFILWFLYVVKNVDVKKKLTTVLLLLHLIWFSMLVSLISVIIYIYMYRSIWSLMCLLLNVCVHIGLVTFIIHTLYLNDDCISFDELVKAHLYSHVFIDLCLLQVLIKSFLYPPMIRVQLLCADSICIKDFLLGSFILLNLNEKYVGNKMMLLTLRVC